MFLVFVHLNARAGDHAVQRAVAELAVVVLAGNAEIDVAGGGVSVAAVDEAGDGVDDAGYLAGGPRVLGSALDVEGVHGVEIVADELLDQIVLGYAALLGALDNLVVNVGEVLDVAHPVALVLKVAAQRVEDDVAESVADVGCGVGGDAADVHFDFVGVGGHEFLDPPVQSVVEFHNGCWGDRIPAFAGMTG